jgi:hypothetical protein
MAGSSPAMTPFLERDMTRVRATHLGYYDHLRRKEGAEFTIAKPEHFSERWMEEIGPLSTAAPVANPTASPLLKPRHGRP